MSFDYLDRFHSLEGWGTHVIDLLPYFKRVGVELLRCFQNPHDCHFSAYGHLVVAETLRSELPRLRLLSVGD